MKIGVLFSGGKDSTLTSFLMQQSGFEIELIVFKPLQKHSYMLQGENLDICKLQAEAMNIKLNEFEVSGKKEVEIDEMLLHLKSLNLDGLASGAIESEYQRQRLDYITNKLKIPNYTPIWKKNDLILKMYKTMDIRLSKVAAYGLETELLGKSFDEISKLNYIGHKLLEGGEGETTVLDAPFFKKRIEIIKSKIEWCGSWGEWIIQKAKLVKK